MAEVSDRAARGRATLLAVYVGYPRASVAMEAIREVVATESSNASEDGAP